MDLVAFGCGRLRPRDRRRGTARLLGAAEMWLKTLGSAAGGSAAGGKGCSMGRGAGEAGESHGIEGALGGLAIGRALSGAGLELSPALGGGGGRTGQHPPLPAVLILHSQPSPGQSGGQAWGASGVWGSRALGPRRGRPVTSSGHRAPAGCMGGPSLGGPGRWGTPGRARRTVPPPLRAGLAGRELGGLAQRRAPRARRKATMPLVTGAAAAADAPAQAFAPGARGCSMLQAERSLSAAARPRWAAALRSRERDARGRPGGPPGVWQERRPPLNEAGVVVHEKTVAKWRPYTGRRRQAPDPRVPAVSRQAHKQQHHLVASCEELRRTGGPIGRLTHVPSRGGGGDTVPRGGGAHSSVPATRWRSTSPAALRRT